MKERQLQRMSIFGVQLFGVCSENEGLYSADHSDTTANKNGNLLF